MKPVRNRNNYYDFSYEQEKQKKRREAELRISLPVTNARKYVHDFIVKSIEEGKSEEEIINALLSNNEIVGLLKSIETDEIKLKDFFGKWIKDQVVKYEIRKQKDSGEER